MNKCYFIVCTIFNIGIRASASDCGCKVLTECYREMKEVLLDQDEVMCVEDASIGSATFTVYLKAISEFCSHILNVTTSDLTTYDGRHLYEVFISGEYEEEEHNVEEKPIIIIDAGQEAGVESAGLALYIIEQLIACEENFDMIGKVKWVILPNTNPDGLEYSRYNDGKWKKNLKLSDDGYSFGVDISRNFDSHWDSCKTLDSGFSQTYPGKSSASENETVFIKETLSKYKNHAKVYLSIKKDGHYIGYPFSYSGDKPTNIDLLTKVAGEVTSRVNVRAGGIHQFGNDSIFNLQGKSHCGNSVDYAQAIGLPLSFELRVFLGSDQGIMNKFQTLPRGYEASLRSGYFSGIRELYNVVTNEKKYGKIK